MCSPPEKPTLTADTFPETGSKSTKKWMVGIPVSSDALFSGAMFASERVSFGQICLPNRCVPRKMWPNAMISWPFKGQSFDPEVRTQPEFDVKVRGVSKRKATEKQAGENSVDIFFKYVV